MKRPPAIPPLSDELNARFDDLGEFIRSQREVAKMSVRRLAELAGVSNPYLSQIERGLRRPSADILQQLAKALRIQAETLYVRAGMLDATSEHPVSLPEAISCDPHLTPEQKQAMLAVYQGFRAQGAGHDAPVRAATATDVEARAVPGTQRRDPGAAESPSTGER